MVLFNDLRRRYLSISLFGLSLFTVLLLGVNVLFFSVPTALADGPLPNAVTWVFLYDANFVVPFGYLMVVDDTSNPQYMVIVQKANSANPYDLAAMQSYVAPEGYALPSNDLKNLLVSSNGTTTWIYPWIDGFLNNWWWGDWVYDPLDNWFVYQLFWSNDTAYQEWDNDGKYFVANTSASIWAEAKIRLIYTAGWPNDYPTAVDTSDWWSADSLEPWVVTSYTFTFTVHDDISNPHVRIQFPNGFNYTRYNPYEDVTMSISTIDSWSFFAPVDLSSYNTSYDILLATDYQNPTPLASGSLVRIKVDYIQNPSRWLYSWPSLLYFGAGWSPSDYSISLSDIQIGEPPVDPFVRCDTNSWSINIPYQECISLAYLYTETDGGNWDINNGWFDDVDVSNWQSNYCYGYFDENDYMEPLGLCDEESWFFWSGSDILWVVLTGDGPIKNVYGINLSYNNLDWSIMSGLLNLSSLTYLLFPENNIENIDVTNNTELIYLDVQDNDLVSIDVSNNPSLLFLIAWDNNDDDLWDIDIFNNLLLEALVVDDLYLESIDLSNNPLLRYIDMDWNEFTGVNFSGLGNLVYLDLNDNFLESFDGSSLTNLVRLNLDNNLITSLSVPSMALVYLDLDENLITNLSVPSLYLEELYAWENNLTWILLWWTGIQYLYLQDNKFTEIPTSFVNLTNMQDFNIANNCVDLDAIDSTVLTWLDNIWNYYNIEPQWYCAYVSLTGSLQWDADLTREDGSFGGSNWWATSDLESIRNGFLGDYLGLRWETNQELVYAWESPVTVASMHIYWEAGGNEQDPNVYYFSYWDSNLEEWVTPDAWIADESQQDFRTQYIFELDQAVSTTAVRFTRTDEGSENGIWLSQ